MVVCMCEWCRSVFKWNVMWWGLRLSGGETGAPRTGPPSSPSPLPEITTSSLYRTSYISPPLHRVNRLLCQIDYANDMNVKGRWNGVQIYRQGWLKWNQRQYHHQEWYHYPNRAERGVCRFMDQSVTGVKIQSEVIEMWRTVGLLVVSEAPGNNARDKVMKVNCKKCRPWHTMHWWLCNYCNYIFKISETNRQHSSICSSSSQIIKSFKQLEWKVESLKNHLCIVYIHILLLSCTKAAWTLKSDDLCFHKASCAFSVIIIRLFTSLWSPCSSSACINLSLQLLSWYYHL